jgi:hypothetical protein
MVQFLGNKQYYTVYRQKQNQKTDMNWLGYSNGKRKLADHPPLESLTAFFWFLLA